MLTNSDGVGRHKKKPGNYGGSSHVVCPPFGGVKNGFGGVRINSCRASTSSGCPIGQLSGFDQLGPGVEQASCRSEKLGGVGGVAKNTGNRDVFQGKQAGGVGGVGKWTEDLAVFERKWSGGVGVLEILSLADAADFHRMYTLADVASFQGRRQAESKSGAERSHDRLAKCKMFLGL